MLNVSIRSPLIHRSCRELAPGEVVSAHKIGDEVHVPSLLLLTFAPFPSILCLSWSVVNWRLS